MDLNELYKQLGERNLAANKIAFDAQGYPINLQRPIVTDDEGVHTELSMTDKFGDKFVNMPTIWQGRRYNPDVPAEYNAILNNYDMARSQGWQFPEFSNVEEAVAAAQERSKLLDTLRSIELQKAYEQYERNR